jgi:hypothetical protein
VLDRSSNWVHWIVGRTETSVLALLLRDIGSEDVSLYKVSVSVFAASEGGVHTMIAV